MLTLIHAPQSRSSRIIWLLEELGAEYDIRYVSIRRWDGSGGPDDNNPHPHKQVPALLHNGALITESTAVVQYLVELYPQSELGRPPGHAERGAYLSWLAYYAGVIEPSGSAFLSGVAAGHPALLKVYEDMCVHVVATLTKQPYLLGNTISAADLLLVSALTWMRKLLPDSAVVDQYVQSITARPALARARAVDVKPDGFHD
ncbi:glutathione S-transferase [Pararhizobium sp. YC-54]|uniref:glutathione S-transferase family protein n=1 Tax=Pararhizobium sp. YC-54 TaxID=2986920 RepID=UPI0021F72240|nr:glutathione S-transferase [Pararhizobium sp. YC-54]MCW0001937.1 glutathione S-transferase [Pararhizobium sp. YC-54]